VEHTTKRLHELIGLRMDNFVGTIRAPLDKIHAVLEQAQILMLTAKSMCTEVGMVWDEADEELFAGVQEEPTFSPDLYSFAPNAGDGRLSLSILQKVGSMRRQSMSMPQGTTAGVRLEPDQPMNGPSGRRRSVRGGLDDFHTLLGSVESRLDSQIGEALDRINRFVPNPLGT